MGRFKIQSGELRNRVTIVQGHRSDPVPYPGGSDSGDAPTGTLGPLPARVTPLSGRERINAAAVQATTTHRIVIRDAVPRLDVRPVDRVEFDGRTLEIESVIRVQERGFWIEIVASEIAR